MSSTVLLDVRRLNKRFGGVVATDQVDLQIAQGEIHALIGPNGAGKTTLVAQLAGQVPSDSGSVHFDGADITHMATHLRAHRGLVRSFQITRLFKSMSVLDNVALAIQASLGQVFSAWRPVKQDVESHDRAMAILERLGLADKHHWRIEQLSHGEQIDSLRRDFSVLLIEHDVEAVFRLADTVSVLVSGRIVASGKPADVRANPAVTAAYLGAAQ